MARRFGLGQRVKRAWNSLFADGAGASAPGPANDYWYSPYGLAGVTPDRAMQLSAVYSCVRVCAESLASYPLIIYRRLPSGGKERATDHPLFKVLAVKPNLWQTSFEFIEMMQGHLDLRGNAYAVIQPGPMGAVEQLLPLHPDRVSVWRLPSGELQYKVASIPTGRIDIYSQDEIFHVRGFSANGITGLSPISVQHEMISKALGMQEFGARYFQNSATPSGTLEHPETMSQEAYDRLKESYKAAASGENRHNPIILEEGVKWQQIAISNKDSQFLEATLASREEICGMYRVPPHKIGILARATNNNIEHQGIEFVTDCMLPRAERWEARINCDLIEPLGLPGDFFAEFLMDGALRGDLPSRYGAYAIGKQNGWLSSNDICRMENRNPIAPEDGGDDYWRPANYTVAEDTPDLLPLPTAPPADTADEANPEPPPDDSLPSNASDPRRVLRSMRVRLIPPIPPAKERVLK